MTKTKSSHRIIAVFLTLNFLVSILPVNTLWAGNNGPNAPEASGFEPVNATDMVNLSSGDMSYVLPLLEIDGFPVTLSYHSGVPMDMEASWVGLGWNINTGAIARGVVANPDDWYNGRRLNLTYLHGRIDSYSVNVGVGIAKAAEVGVGLSWGSNKSISGSVSASIGSVSASIDTNGNYSVGVGVGLFNSINDDKGGIFGGSMSLSGNINKGGLAANIGVGGRTVSGLSAGMGVSISGNGVGTSFSVGKSNNQTGSDARSAGAGISMNSFSAGDYSYNTKGFYIPLQIGIFSFGFGFSRSEITLANAYNKYAFGSLYHSSNNLYDTNLGIDYMPSSINTNSDDYQRRNTFGDVYEQVLPQSEEEFIGDYRYQIEKLNFSFAGYDSYDINASGIGGALRPIIGQNSVLVGEGYDGSSIRDADKKTKVFYHNSQGNFKPSKSFTASHSSVNKLSFSFDGQITENAIVSGNTINESYSGSSVVISNFINTGGTLPKRPKSGSFIEVYTNAEINTYSNAAQQGVLIPASLKTDSGALSRQSQGYVLDGIGGYKITTPDGKTYHFMQPVYQYEQVQHSFLNFEADSPSKFNSSTKRDGTPYATHWLLTAITGPDYIDNGNNFPDENDFGYWVRLDHGQWSNAYAWRSPFDNKEYTDTNYPNFPYNKIPLNKRARKSYSTFIDNEVEKSDPGHFQQGRKDLYYLDKIVSKNQTAFFVKDIRYDGFGTSAHYNFVPSGTFNDKIDENAYGGGAYVQHREEAKYEREYQLRLDKIIIVNKSENDVNILTDTGNGLAGVQEQNYPNRYKSGGFFNNQLPPQAQIHKMHLSNNVIDVIDAQSFDYSQAAKVIKFDHQYVLAKNSPSSGYHSEYDNANLPNPDNPNFSKLTLMGVKTYGRGTVPNANEDQLYDYMPPYQFDYYYPEAIYEENRIEEVPINPNSSFAQLFRRLYGNDAELPKQYKYVRANKDNWGFREGEAKDNDGNVIIDEYGNPVNSAIAWSLKTITTPQGSNIDVSYEEDDFHVEAFGRRYWENNLVFNVRRNTSLNNTIIKVQKDPGMPYEVNFDDYFEIGERVYMDLWICRKQNEREGWDYKTRTGEVDLRSEDRYCKVINVNSTEVTIQFEDNTGLYNGSRVDTYLGVNSDKWYGKRDNLGSPNYEDKIRGACPSTITGGNNHSIKFKLLSNKIAPGTSGGGLRVKDIVVNDDYGNKYITRYDYNDPFKGRTSGITSFNPIRGEVFAPYQNELPGPGVMYEWVTMKALELDANNNEKEIGKTRYHYYTLNPYFPIFNPNIEMTDIDGDPIFKTTVEDKSMAVNDLTAKDIKVEKNLSKIGQLISIEEFNEVGQLMNKTVNTYQPRYGELSETFSTMKSVFDFELDDDDNDGQNYQLEQRYLALSTKSEKVSVLKKVDNITTAGTNTVEYSEPDPWLGTYTTSIRSLSDGTLIKDKKIPAYTKYPNMGSKVLDPTNKNMLTQEAMSISQMSETGGSTWGTLNASITTWNDTWTYRDQLGNNNTQGSIWRKHKSFVWKDDIHPISGTYNTPVNYTNNYFNWATGTPTSTKWQQVSEVTRYTHWSSPVETKDINNNFAASKMADDFSKVIASGNARYTELYYSGAEHVLTGNNFEGEIQGANYRTDEVAHTGEYAVKNNNANDKVFRVSGQTSAEHNDLSQDFRPGKYKVSFWSHNQKDVDAATVKLNGSSVPVAETVDAGCWKQFNYYVDLQPNASFELFVTNTSGGGFYFDDFRMHPVYASMNSYVYDKNTDELLYILDANNMGSAYRYDDAGRLKATYKEVESSGAFDGGFKLVGQYKQHYQNTSGAATDYNEDINNCITQSFDPLTSKGLSRNCIPQYNPYDIQYAMHVSGGSGSYKYEWQYLIDIDTNEYTNWYQGTAYEFIPYENKYCDEQTFDKLWVVKAKVTDLVTGEIVTANSEYVTNDCLGYIINPKLMLGVEASYCHGNCGESKFKFHLYPLDDDLPLPSNTGYVDNNTGISYNVDLQNTDGLFCPEIKYVRSRACSSGYIEYASITPTHQDHTNYTYEFYLNCVPEKDVDLNRDKMLGDAPDSKYAAPGIMVVKQDGKIISVIDTTKK